MNNSPTGSKLDRFKVIMVVGSFVSFCGAFLFALISFFRVNDANDPNHTGSTLNILHQAHLLIDYGLVCRYVAIGCIVVLIGVAIYEDYIKKSDKRSESPKS
jgi:sulfite exporter TauE/SafE